MSRIFLSHSSVDEREAVALRDWLAQNGWDDVFLDLDPQRGLLAGERWQEALRRAADRCEAVVFIVTPAWARSKWCTAEFLLAKTLNKRIFGAILKPVELSELPTELTSEWQLTHLAGDGRKSVIAFSHKGETDQIEFLTEGLDRLRIGLEKAGLDARYFRWPPPDDPKRPPYRGLVPLEEKDAAIYFGRDAQIIRGLDALRGMRATGVETLFVILGPSGCGKSSFLRAGLLPRLKRDDRHFLPLEIIRPERQPITGERGLASAVHKAGVDLHLAGQTLGAIKTALMQDTGQLSRLLSEIQGAARARLRATSEEAAPPTLLLSIDQAEELFNPDATDDADPGNSERMSESRLFLTLVGTTLRDADAERPLLIVAFTIRSDRYEPLQTATELTGLKSKVFDDLKPMPSQQFREVIIGPAHRATSAGNRLEIEPDLVRELVNDCILGADTLPLLSLTLSRLYRDYGSDGDLLLEEYRTMGGMGSVVNSEVESVLARDPAKRKAQLDHLNAAFIPWLATINRETDEPMSRLSRYADLPAESRPLIDALAERRLLVIDQRNHEKVVEVAHEALLRRWGELANWLKAEREDLKLAQVMEQAAQDWQSGGRKADWLMEGERLAVAEALAANPSYRGRLAPVSEFLLASRQRESERREKEERRRQEELRAAREKQANAEALAKALKKHADAETKSAQRQRRFTRILAAVAIFAMFVGGLAFWQRAEARRQAIAKENARAEAQKQALAAENALTRYFVRSISRPHGFKPLPDEREALWELAELDAANENIRRMVIDRWLETDDFALLMRPLEYASKGLHAAIGLNVALKTYWSSRATVALGRLAKALESTLETDRLRSLGETLTALAAQINPEAAAPLAAGLAKALKNTPETDLERLSRLGGSLAALAARMSPEAAAPLTAPAAAVIAKALENTPETDFERLSSLTLAALAARMSPEAAAPLAAGLAKALKNTPETDLERLSRLGGSLAALAARMSPEAAAPLTAPAAAVIAKALENTPETDFEFLSSPLGETLAALAARMSPEAAAPLAVGLAKALKSTPETDFERLSSLGESLAALAARMSPEAAAPLAAGLAKALKNTPETDLERLSSLGGSLAALAARMSPEAAAPLVEGLAKALKNTRGIDSGRLSSLGESLAVLAARFPQESSTRLLALSNVFLQRIPNPQEQGPEERIRKTVRTACVQLRPRDLVEVLNGPFVWARPRSLSSLNLKRRLVREPIVPSMEMSGSLSSKWTRWESTDSIDSSSTSPRSARRLKTH